MAGLIKEERPKECKLCPDDFRLQLLTDIDMLLLAEKGIQDGITQAVKRYAKTNNENYMNHLCNPDEESLYLQYLDENNLYRWAMVQNLPTYGFKWENGEDLTPRKKWMNLSKKTREISFRGRCEVSKRAVRKSK